MKLGYHLVDVFAEAAFGGNPLAVFPDAAGVPAPLMQRIANELNLSETAFVLPADGPGADFRVRIFTPAVEMPMAGHPTVGTAHVLARLGRITPAQTRVVFQEGVGPVPVAVAFEGGQPDLVTMDQPVPRFGAPWADRAALADLLSLDLADLVPELPAEPGSAGVPFLFVPLKGLDAVRRAALRLDRWARRLKDYEAPNVYVFTLETERPGSTVHGRMFAPALGIAEDPATGAANGPLGAYLVRHGLATPGAPLVSEQGFEMGRPSLLHLRVEGTPERIARVTVGGRSVSLGQGQLELPDEAR